MKEIRFGIIGCGLMGREFASAAARWLHLVNPKAKPRIVAVCDTNPTLMDWFAGHLGPIQTTRTPSVARPGRSTGCPHT